ncbi:hypothetical protein [Bradyrhizobium sp. 141]|uniref:hypothetical protein n=1 Tax=Bradyrhizobium sp. 141 TaxID=2782617 RepID=UPI001FF939BA|nr:hypothetical protein [Bradyrhizobium sp. 141]MCK1719861.1 hypothetical protein [Bradyrhizobium sp. 141]
MSYLFYQANPSFFERWRRYAAQWMAPRDRPYCRHGGNLEIIQDLKASAAGNRRSGGDKRPFRRPGGVMWTTEMQKRPQINLFAQERGKAPG